MHRMRDFLKAAGERGWPSMAGTFVFVTISILEHYWDHSLASYVFVVLAAAIFCWGAFSAWSDADHKVERLEKELADQLPKIEGKICLGYLDIKKLYARGNWKDVPNGCTITLGIEAVNRNNQTAWFVMPPPRLSAVINGIEYAGVHVALATNVLSVNDPAFLGDKKLCNFFTPQYSHESFSMEKGNPRSGWIMFYVESLDLMLTQSQIDSTLTIILTDTLGAVHSISGAQLLKTNLIYRTDQST